MSFAICTVTIVNISFNLVATYFKFRTPTSVHLRKLEIILNALDGHSITAADVNAHSDRWFSTHADP